MENLIKIDRTGTADQFIERIQAHIKQELTRPVVLDQYVGVTSYGNALTQLEEPDVTLQTEKTESLPRVLIVQARPKGHAQETEEAILQRAAAGKVKLEVVNPLDSTSDFNWGNPDTSQYAGLLITGSNVDIYSNAEERLRHPDAVLMTERLAPLLAKTIPEATRVRRSKRKPVLGICAGQHAIHTFLNGKVAWVEDTKETGTNIVMLAPGEETHPLLADMPLQRNGDQGWYFPAFWAHDMSVVEPGRIGLRRFKRVGTSPRNPNTWLNFRDLNTLQFHPERENGETNKTDITEATNKYPTKYHVTPGYDFSHTQTFHILENFMTLVADRAKQRSR